MESGNASLLLRAGNELAPCERQDIWNILLACDHDFMPPLSERTSSCQKDLLQRGAGESDGPHRYFEELMKQEFVIFESRGQVQGFLSYRLHWQTELFPSRDSIYITTVCVPKELRGQGIASSLYRALEEEAADAGKTVPLAIRTWSTNRAQLSLLGKLGYRVAARLADDRGQGIDTLYFWKLVEG